MRTRCTFALALIASLVIAPAVQAQNTPADLKDGFKGRYHYAAQRLVALAEAIPEDKFAWSPGEGVMSIERVFMHIIRYNYYYPASSLGIEAPDGIDVPNLESLTGKAVVLDHLRPSLDHVAEVLANLSEADLSQSVVLYGRDTEAWNVLFQLQGHMAEHLGQLIAYARMNEIVPPWSK